MPERTPFAEMVHVNALKAGVGAAEMAPEQSATAAVYPEPETVPESPLAPLFGFKAKLDITVKFVSLVVVLGLPVARTPYVPPNASDLTVKLHAEMLPAPVTVHVMVGGPQSPGPPGLEITDKVRKVSEAIQPNPVTVTVVPVGPELGVSVNIGLVTVSVAETDPCWT